MLSRQRATGVVRGMKIIDLTMPLYEGMVGHPSHPDGPKLLSGTLSHRLTRHFMGRTERFGQASFQNEQFVLHGHCGTHLDAPYHADPNGVTVESIPLEYACGPAIWLDVSNRYGPGEVVTAADLEGALASSDSEMAPIVLLHTGWGAVYDQNPTEYYRHGMGISEDGSDWLRGQGVLNVGIDSPTVDPHSSADCPAHMNLLRTLSYGSFSCVMENLVGIDRIPTHRFFFVGAPLYLKGASASPIRALAICDLDVK